LFKGSDTPTNYARAMYAMHLPAPPTHTT